MHCVGSKRSQRRAACLRPTPTLQNIPIRSELGREIRAAFVAPPGHLLVSADYSQIELRVLAHLSKDALLVDSFQSGQDVHTRTAIEVFGVAPADVTAENAASRESRELRDRLRAGGQWPREELGHSESGSGSVHRRVFSDGTKASGAS